MSKRLAAALLLLCPLPLAACATPSPAATLSGTLAPGEHQVTLRGVRIWYRIAGNWDGRSAPVVYLAGGPGGNSYVFERSAGPYLEPAQLVVYYDQRGTGRSERPANGDYGLATLVDDIEALRQHLAVPRLALIAHSFGGVLALEYAARYPERVAAAVVAGTLWDAPMACREGLRRIARTSPELYRRVTTNGEPRDDQVCSAIFSAIPAPERQAFIDGNMYPIAATRERREAMEAESGLRNSGEMSTALFRQGLLRYRFGGIREVTAPVLVVAGAKDFQSGLETQRTLARSLPNGRFLAYPNFGHWMFVDDPERFGRDVSRFLRRAQRHGYSLALNYSRIRNATRL